MTCSFSRGIKGAEQTSVLGGAEPTRELSVKVWDGVGRQGSVLAATAVGRAWVPPDAQLPREGKVPCAALTACPSRVKPNL